MTCQHPAWPGQQVGGQGQKQTGVWRGAGGMVPLSGLAGLEASAAACPAHLPYMPHRTSLPAALCQRASKTTCCVLHTIGKTKDDQEKEAVQKKKKKLEAPLRTQHLCHALHKALPNFCSMSV